MSHQLIPYRLEEPVAPVATDSLSHPEPTDSLAKVPSDSLALIPADSLVSITPDSLAKPHVEVVAPYELPFALRSSLEETPSRKNLRYNETSAEELFGYSSMQAEIPYTPHAAPALTATPLFGAFVLGLVIFYALMLHQHLSDAITLVGRVSRERATGERLTEDSTGDYTRFINLAVTLGLLLTGAAVMRIAAPFVGYTPLAEWPHTGAFMGSLGIVAALGLVILYRQGLSLLIGRLTYTQQLFEQLNRLASTFFALLTLLSTPLLALWLLAPLGEGNLWLWVIIIELIVVFVLYLNETLSLFISKKISILHWILYLCGVEILPMSFLVLLVMR
ncbi:MAG: DUF4271 domain-containing protein [Rikenellaceae bacterium]|nr:DUF4271 domain-containing protein [Rikenellaceae bacterium]